MQWAWIGTENRGNVRTSVLRKCVTRAYEKMTDTGKFGQTVATPKESTGEWKLALINDWTKTWFVGT